MSLPTIRKQIKNISYFLPGVTWEGGMEEFGYCNFSGDIHLRMDICNNPVLFNIVFRHEIDHWCQITFKEVTLEPPKEEFVHLLLQANGQPISLYRNYVVNKLEWEVHLRDFLHLAYLQGMSREEVLKSNFKLATLDDFFAHLDSEQFLLFRLLNFNNSLLQQIVDLWWEE
jgi:hypothetical protein